MVGARPTVDALRSPTKQLTKAPARARQIVGMQLEMHQHARLMIACVSHATSNEYRYTKATKSIDQSTVACWERRAVLAPSGGVDELVSEEGEAVTDGPGIDQAQGFLVARLAEQALAVPEHDREHDEPQLVDQVVLE